VSELTIRATSTIKLVTPDLRFDVTWHKGHDLEGVAGRIVRVLALGMDKKDFEVMLARWACLAEDARPGTDYRKVT
jgi:hypothetical protein